MPNLRIYRRAWIVPAVIALLTLLLLHSPDAPPVSDQPTSFEGERALADARTLALRFPGRTPGSEADARSAIWLVERLKELGLQPHIETFAATVDGRTVALQNIWAVSPGKTQGAIVVLANRDSPPLDTQGADDNASGVAMVLELARVFTVTAHAHPIVFLWTDGDAYGSIGSDAFVARHPELRIIAVVALRRVGAADMTRLALDGWSAAPRVAPPWLWLLASSSQRTVAGLWTPLPSPFTQVLHLAAPVGSGSQGPFVAAGAAAVSLGGG
ncbi:MAG TPA: M28 family peptidase, partial [Thermoleophilia bacterium]|nr:M28 family peptidase [Thermoleophilia bacterium]